MRLPIFRARARPTETIRRGQEHGICSLARERPGPAVRRPARVPRAGEGGAGEGGEAAQGPRDGRLPVREAQAQGARRQPQRSRADPVQPNQLLCRLRRHGRHQPRQPAVALGPGVARGGGGQGRAPADSFGGPAAAAQARRAVARRRGERRHVGPAEPGRVATGGRGCAGAHLR